MSEQPASLVPIHVGISYMLAADNHRKNTGSKDLDSRKIISPVLAMQEILSTWP